MPASRDGNQMHGKQRSTYCTVALDTQKTFQSPWQVKASRRCHDYVSKVGIKSGIKAISLALINRCTAVSDSVSCQDGCIAEKHQCNPM